MTVFIFMNRVRTSINLDIIMADNPSSGDSSISYKWPFFILYCSGGLCGIAYAAYSSFKKVESQGILDPLAKMKKQRTIHKDYTAVKKGVLLGCVYMAGLTYFLFQLNVSDRVLRQAMKKDSEYVGKVQTNYAYQDFHIYSVMRFFGISQRLIRKAEAEMKAKSQNQEGQDKLSAFQQLIYKMAK